MNRIHTGAKISFQPRIRRGAFFESAWDYGCRNFSVYNRTYISGSFSDPEKEYWHVIENVAVWPVMGERQVEITGVDAFEFIEKLTSRDMSKCKVGQCKYGLFLDSEAGILADPIILRLEENKYWISTSDSDLELWMKGVQINSGLQVSIRDANVSLLQVQGPKSSALMAKIFGEKILDLKYYWFGKFEFRGLELFVSRTGWSGELGYELYLQDHAKGSFLFEQLMIAGKDLSILPGSVNHSRRIEAGILSWGVDMTSNETPYEVGLGRLVELETTSDFIGKRAALKLSRQTPKRSLVGFKIDGNPLKPNETPWKLFSLSELVGSMTSLAYSPRLKCNIGFALVDNNYTGIGTQLIIEGYGLTHRAEVVPTPFIEKKQLADAKKLAFINKF